jgi:DNA-binding transcriptional ArsR family regulator
MDLTGWLEFFVKGLSTQLDEVKTLGTNTIKSHLTAKDYDLNNRQMIAIEELLNSGKMTIGEYELHFPDVNRRTLQRDLKSLLEKGLILEIGSGPTDNNRYFQLKVS